MNENFKTYFKYGNPCFELNKKEYILTKNLHNWGSFDSWLKTENIYDELSSDERIFLWKILEKAFGKKKNSGEPEIYFGEIEITRIKPALDFAQEKMFIGQTVTVDETGKEKYCLITNQKEIIFVENPQKLQQEENLIIEGLETTNEGKEYLELPITRRWSMKGIQRFLESEKEINGKELFERILNKIKFHVEHIAENEYYIDTAFVLASYLYPMFETAPQISLNGIKASGKSRLGKVIELLCFNGKKTVNSSTAALYRLASIEQATLIQDEEENLSAPDFTERLTFFNSRYERGNKRTVLISKGRNYIRREFDVYGMTVFSSISGTNHVLESRTIPIIMRQTRKENPINEREPKQQNPEWQKIRDDIYIWAMQNHKKIKENYEALEENPTQIKARDFQLFRPLIAAVKTIDEKITEKIIEYGENNLKESRNFSNTGSWEYILITKTLKAHEGKTEVIVRLNELTHLIREELMDENGKAQPSSRWVRATLRKMGLQMKDQPMLDGYPRISFDYAELKEIAMRLGFIKED